MNNYSSTALDQQYSDHTKILLSVKTTTTKVERLLTTFISACHCTNTLVIKITVLKSELFSQAKSNLTNRIKLKCLKTSHLRPGRPRPLHLEWPIE